MASQDWLEKDFYKVLGVAADVSDKELTKAYHKLARKYHPDRNPGDKTAEAEFKKISEAYSVLSDKTQRAEYDQIRAYASSGARFTASGSGYDDLFSGFRPAGGGFPGGGFPGGGGFEDIFNMFNSAGGGFNNFATATPGRDITASTTVDFMTAVNGGTVSITTPAGQVKVRIPAGIADGKKIKLRGRGEHSRNGGAPGDLLLTVRVRPHPVFEREGNNLRVKLPVTFTEAVFGATVEVPTLGGGSVKLKILPNTPSGRVLRVKGGGIESKSGKGDLYAEVQIVVPSNLNPEQEAALRAYSQLQDEDNPRADMLARNIQ